MTEENTTEAPKVNGMMKLIVNIEIPYEIGDNTPLDFAMAKAEEFVAAVKSNTPAEDAHIETEYTTWTSTPVVV